jgi:hypothetical protein
MQMTCMVHTTRRRFNLSPYESPSWYSSVTEEYQDGENSYREFFGFVPFLQLAIHMS